MKGFTGILLTLLLAGILARPQADDDGDYTFIPDQDYETENDPTANEEEAGESTPVVLPTFVETETNIVIREGEPLTISCRTTNPNDLVLMMQRLSPFAIMIYVGNNLMQTNSKFVQDQKVFTIQSAKRKDAGHYQCLYQVEEKKITRNYTVEVQYRPRFTKKGLAEQKVKRGDTVSFECQADGVPAPEVSWSKQDGVLPAGDKTQRGISLDLQNVDRHEEGTYICSASNGIGQPITHAMKLLVEYPPEIYTLKDIIRTGSGDEVQLICFVHARPAGRVIWSKDGVPLTAEANVEADNKGHRHYIKITHVTEEDFGSYTCNATNYLGEDSEVIKLTDLPKQPNFTSSREGGEEDTYTLTWETESYYPIVEYILKYRPFSKNESKEWIEIPVDVEQPGDSESTLIHHLNYTIQDLEPATEYEVLVSVKNKLHWGSENLFKFSTKKAAPPTTYIITTPPPKPEESAQTKLEEISSQISGGAGMSSMSVLGLVLALLMVLRS